MGHLNFRLWHYSFCKRSANSKYNEILLNLQIANLYLIIAKLICKFYRIN